MTPISKILTDLHLRFKPVSDTPLLDAQVLVAHLLGKSRSWLLAHQEISISPAQQKILDLYSDRILSGEPLPYILGKWEFYSLEFIVTPDTLIPRPETELLVEHALAISETKTGKVLVVDVGTGSGCIAVSLAACWPEATIIGGDISLPALKIARENARKHDLDKRIHLLLCDLFPPLNEKVDILCANLPYIPRGRLTAARPSGWEPGLALNGGSDGLALISRLLVDSIGRITRDGLLLLEIDADAGQNAFTLARECYPEADIKLIPDLAGHDRLLRIQLQ